MQEIAQEHPQLTQLESIGKSHEGRDIWAMTVTNFEDEEPEDKPAIYVDGNIHAGEVTGSMTALYLIRYLVRNYGEGDKITRLLDEKTFYVIPRANPDGAEKYLTTPETLRSSVRIYPPLRKDEDPPGLRAEDVDGDGKILLMRIRDDKRGAWKISNQDARLMVRRSPVDLEGPFYHVVTEGVIQDEHGEMVEEVEEPFETLPSPYGLDLNRNFPAGFSAKSETSGPYPLSEPETRAQVEFIHDHKNIGVAVLFHTTGGVLFRPHSTIPDDDFEDEDIKLYKSLGRLGTDATGYPLVCCYGGTWSGVLDDWAFEHKGIFSFTPELWDAVGRAASEFKRESLDRDLSPEEEIELQLKLLKWNDQELAEKGFVPWNKFDHPQFGEVEIGGWDVKRCRQNPPLDFLTQECHKNIQFPLAMALSLPRMSIEEAKAELDSSGAFVVSVLVGNHGYLSTQISQQAQEAKAVNPNRVKIECGEGVEIVKGKSRVEIDHLDGYFKGQSRRFYRYANPGKTCERVNWVVKLDEGLDQGQVTVKVLSDRGGNCEEVINLER